MIDDEDGSLKITHGERINNLRIPLVLTLRNPNLGSIGPHQVTLTQIRPWRGEDGRSSLTLNVIFTDFSPHQRRKIEIYNITEVANGETGEIIDDLNEYLVLQTGQEILRTYGTLPYDYRF